MSASKTSTSSVSIAARCVAVPVGARDGVALGFIGGLLEG
jgi:hypothetical protein